MECSITANLQLGATKRFSKFKNMTKRDKYLIISFLIYLKTRLIFITSPHKSVYMSFESKYIDELIEDRKLARLNKNWKLSDEIRDYLDTKLVFVFDAKWGQEVYYLTYGYFKNQERKIETIAMSKRQYVEYKIKQDINANKNFEAWFFSIRSGLN